MALKDFQAARRSCTASPLKMSKDPCNVSITSKAISLAALISNVEDASAGAIATFTGVTRNTFNGKEVLKLEYEAYWPMAQRKLEEICKACKSRYDIRGISISHRIGTVLVGEASVAIAVSSAHRRPALEACAWAIDELKAEVPIWKKEFFTDGEIWKENAESRQAQCRNASH